MSNVMFENTYRDLYDCANALDDDGVGQLEEDANEYEKPYILKLIELCQEIANKYGE